MVTADGLELRLHTWLVDAPRVTVALCHGYGEHAGRYAHVARALNRRGISLVGGDLRGHGRSDGRRGSIGRFGDYLADLDAIVEAARERAAGGEVALMGHSLGGLVSCAWLLSRGGDRLIGVVLTSPFLGLNTKSRLLATLTAPLSRLAPELRADAGFTGEDLTHDPELARAYDADPLVNKKVVLRTIQEARAAIRRVHERAGELTRPTLLLYAGDDRIVSADSTDRFAESLRMADRTCERLPGYYHEVLNEPRAMREPLLDRIAAWLLDRAERPGPQAVSSG